MGKQSRKIVRICLMNILLVSMLSGIHATAYTDMQTEQQYTYDDEGKSESIPDAYEYAGAISLSDDHGVEVNNPQDLYISQDGTLYIADTDNNRILIYDRSFRYKSEITEIRLKDGRLSSLNKPQGVYAYSNGDILIADTQNSRIVRCDKSGNEERIIGKPSDMTGLSDDFSFLPLKIACDSIGRVDVIAQNVNFGIVQLDSSGTFLGYTGAPDVQTDLFTLFWRKFSTKAQKNQMEQFVSTEYDNIYVDNDNFLWGTISDLDSDSIQNAINSKDKSGTVTPIRKLNSLGNDVLKRNGQFAPIGDLTFDETPSKIVDIAVGLGGIYSMVDVVKGHIFTYDGNGNLLFIFGQIGDRSEDMQNPSAIGYVGNEILVLDAGLGCIQLYQPTSFGKLVIDAVSQQYQGNFRNAYELWTKVANQSTTFQYAFVGLGNADLSQGKYKSAMTCFQYAKDQQDYSYAFGLLRKQQMKNILPLIIAGIIVLFAAWILFGFIRKFYRYYKGKQE